MTSKQRKRHPPPALFSLVATAATVGGTLALRWRWAWAWLPAYLLVVNLVTFLLYWYDKAASGRGLLRVPEWTLHVFAIAGGSPAAFGAQQLFRHKTRKRSFRVVFWLLVVLQAAVLFWALTRTELQ